jgi:hypothetical protein
MAQVAEHLLSKSKFSSSKSQFPLPSKKRPGSCLIGTEFLLQRIKHLERDSGDGCTTLWEYLMPLYHPLKRG